MSTDITCDYVQKNLSAYYDKELDKELSAKIQEHLRCCITCRREFSNIAKMSYKFMTSYKDIDCPELVLDLNKISTCHFVMQNLNDFLDKQLPKKDASVISEHLLNCKACREDYDKLKETKKIVNWYFDVFKIPSGVVNYKKILNDILVNPRNKVAWASVACLAGAVFLMLLSAIMFSPQNINPPSVATKDVPANEILQDKNEIKVNNIQPIEIH